ncbi:zinc-ribbon domain-containing protein [Alkalicoccobacillus gibsonii]
MKTCPKCQSQVSENSRFCTNCGANFQGGETREAKGPKVSRTK